MILRGNIKCGRSHASKMQKKKNEDKISVTLEWVLLSATDDVWFMFRPKLWLFCISGATSENPLGFLWTTMHMWGKQTRGGRTSLRFQIKRLSSSPLPTQLWLMSNHVFQTSLPDVFLTSHSSLSLPSIPLIFFQVSIFAATLTEPQHHHHTHQTC